MDVAIRRVFLQSAQELANTNKPSVELIKTHMLNLEQLVRDMTGEPINIRFVMPESESRRVVVQP